MRLVDCEQGSDLWLRARCGQITASRVVDALAVLKKGGESQKRANYRMDLVAERLTGRLTEFYVNSFMQWGIDNEADAREAYGIETGKLIRQVGYVRHPAMDFSGGSPDGLIDRDGGVEIKCPQTTTHLEWMLAGVVPPEHEPQMVWNMVCCERQWWDFVSFDPRLPEDLQLFIVRLSYDDKRVSEIDAAVRQFNAEVEDTIAKLRNRSLQAQLEASLEAL